MILTVQQEAFQSISQHEKSQWGLYLSTWFSTKQFTEINKHQLHKKQIWTQA